MGRLVEYPAHDDMGDQGSYLERVAKYVPAEIVTLFMVLRGILREPHPATTMGLVLGCMSVVAGLILTPAYLNLASRRQTRAARKEHIPIATVAFVLWAYALEWPFDEMHMYHSKLAAFMLLIFTFVAGILRPKCKQ